LRSLSREEVRRVDACAIETLGIPGVILMENAGLACAHQAVEMLAGTGQKRVAILAGAGNNGGDGFVMARHLRIARIETTVYLVADEQKLTGDARINWDAARAVGVSTKVLGDDISAVSRALLEADFVVDAVGGTGIRGALRGTPAEVAREINAAGRPVLAVDIPTGLDCDSGRAEGPAVRAVRTVTFLARKQGFDVPDAQEYTGEVYVAHIGIPLADVARRARLDLAP
jgi:NAD(P)H-hydrate epimerase